MPFTFAHPAAVLPFKYLPGRWFSFTGLVIGSITPDFEYFIRMNVVSVYTHTWAGLFWCDLPLGLLLMLVYQTYIKDKLTDHFPSWLNRRFSRFKNSEGPHTRHSFVFIAISVLIGAATHVFWDSFTHYGGYFQKHIPLLHHHVIIMRHSLGYYNILQDASSLIGSAIVVLAVIYLPAGKETKKKHIANYWAIIIITALAVLAARMLGGLNTGRFGNIIVTFISGLLIGLIIASAVTPGKETAAA